MEEVEIAAQMETAAGAAANTIEKQAAKAINTTGEQAAEAEGPAASTTEELAMFRDGGSQHHRGAGSRDGGSQRHRLRSWQQRCRQPAPRAFTT